MVQFSSVCLLLTAYAVCAQYEEVLPKLRRALATDTSRSFNYSYAVRKDDPNGQRLDNFGRSIAISNGVALVGSPEDDDNVVAEDAGAVFVFIEDSANSDWRLIRQLEDGDPGDYFGWSVALHTDGFSVIGACRGNRYGKFSGGAYTQFIETDPYGEQEIPRHVTPSERHGNQYFGFSVAIGTNKGHVKVVIGAYGHRGRGAAFVYNRKADGSLTDEKILYGSDSVYDDKFGWSVDIYHDIVVAGAPMDNNQGSAYAFEEGSDGTYTQITKLAQTMLEDDVNNPLYGDYYGMCVAVGNGFIAVASPHNDVRGNDAGAVYIYTRQTPEDDTATSDTYEFSQALFAPNAGNNWRFGWSMDYDPINDRLAVGVDFSRLTSATGKVFLFAMSPSTFFSWEATVLPITNANDDYEEPGGANFGFAVSIYGDYLGIGSEFGHGEKDMTGDAYFFRAQTKKQYQQRKNGFTDSEETSITDSAFGSVGLALLIVVPLCGLIVLFMWYRYKSDGENEGFGTYVADELADAWDNMTARKSQGDSALRFMEEDDSQHSSHPMMDSRPPSSSSSDASSSSSGREKKSRSKLSSLKSGSSKGGSYSKSSRSAMGSSSSKRAAGYTSANVDDL